MGVLENTKSISIDLTTPDSNGVRRSFYRTEPFFFCFKLLFFNGVPNSFQAKIIAEIPTRIVTNCLENVIHTSETIKTDTNILRYLANSFFFFFIETDGTRSFLAVFRTIECEQL